MVHIAQGTYPIIHNLGVSDLYTPVMSRVLCALASFSDSFYSPTPFSESLCDFVRTTLHTLSKINILLLPRRSTGRTARSFLCNLTPQPDRSWHRFSSCPLSSHTALTHRSCTGATNERHCLPVGGSCAADQWSRLSRLRAGRPYGRRIVQTVESLDGRERSDQRPSATNGSQSLELRKTQPTRFAKHRAHESPSSATSSTRAPDARGR